MHEGVTHYLYITAPIFAHLVSMTKAKQFKRVTALGVNQTMKLLSCVWGIAHQVPSSRYIHT